MKNPVAGNLINGNAWFERWFDSAFYHKLYAERNEEEAKSFVDELMFELTPRVNASILDLACGNGRHSKYLAAKGLKVTGIDLASSSIREAKKWESTRLRFYCQDMRLPFGNHAFDFVLSFFTSFGYFEDPADDDRILDNISMALKPGGILMMDYMNPSFAEINLRAQEEKEVDGIIYSITRWTDEKYIYKKIQVEEKLFGKPLEYTEQVRKFYLEDFDFMFDKHGLELYKVFGDYNLSEFNKETSRRVILFARKGVH